MFTDPVLQNLIKNYPAPTFTDRSDFLFEDLIESIVSQQLSIKAADTIYGRFKKLFEPILQTTNRGGASEGLPLARSPLAQSAQDEHLRDEQASGPQEYRQDPSKQTFPNAKDILAMPDEKIREAGISFQKISYIKSVADAFVSDLIDKEKIKAMTDEEVIQALTQIRGVGKWTAEMILIFTLKRPDVFSVGDLGIRNAITKLYGITDKQEMIKLAENWKPYRSTACWYLWRSLENK